MSLVDVRADRYREVGSRVKGHRIAAHLVDHAVTYARDSGADPTIAQAARAALVEFDANADHDDAWLIWSTEAGYRAKVPSAETRAHVRERLVELAEVP